MNSKAKILSPNQVNFAPGAKILTGANILSNNNHFVADDVIKGKHASVSPDSHFKKGSAPLRPKP